MKHLLIFLMTLGLVFTVGCNDSSTSGGPGPVTEGGGNDDDDDSGGGGGDDGPVIEGETQAYKEARTAYVRGLEATLVGCGMKDPEIPKAARDFATCHHRMYPGSESQQEEMQAFQMVVETFVATPRRKRDAEGAFSAPGEHFLSGEQRDAKAFLAKLNAAIEEINFNNAYIRTYLPDLEPKLAAHKQQVEALLAEIPCDKTSGEWVCPDYTDEELQQLGLDEIRRRQNIYAQLENLERQSWEDYRHWPAWNVPVIQDTLTRSRSFERRAEKTHEAIGRMSSSKVQSHLVELNQLIGEDRLEAYNLKGYPGEDKYSADSSSREPVTEAQIQNLRNHEANVREFVQFVKDNSQVLQGKVFEKLWFGYGIDHFEMYTAEDYDLYPHENMMRVAFNLDKGRATWNQRLQELHDIKGNQLWADRQANYKELQNLWPVFQQLENADRLAIRWDVKTFDMFLSVRTWPHPKVSEDLEDLKGLLETRESLLELVDTGKIKNFDPAGKLLDVYTNRNENSLPEATEQTKVVNLRHLGVVFTSISNELSGWVFDHLN